MNKSYKQVYDDWAKNASIKINLPRPAGRGFVQHQNAADWNSRYVKSQGKFALFCSSRRRSPLFFEKS
jgi:hypothetical protein